MILEGAAILEAQLTNGQTVSIGKLETGDFFGEVTLFTSKFNSFTVKALQDLKVIAIFPDEVMEIVELNPRLAQHLDEMMDARRLKMVEF